jgi:hypothetical protein
MLCMWKSAGDIKPFVGVRLWLGLLEPTPAVWPPGVPTLVLALVEPGGPPYVLVGVCAAEDVLPRRLLAVRLARALDGAVKAASASGNGGKASGSTVAAAAAVGDGPLERAPFAPRMSISFASRYEGGAPRGFAARAGAALPDASAGVGSMPAAVDAPTARGCCCCGCCCWGAGAGGDWPGCDFSCGFAGVPRWLLPAVGETDPDCDAPPVPRFGEASGEHCLFLAFGVTTVAV